MIKPASAATLLGALLLVVSAIPAAADAGPNTPGDVRLQPTSVSAGSQPQPASNASLSTGRAGASSEDQSASQCGLKASAAGSGQSAEPARVSTGGNSTPTDCNAAATGNGAASTTTGRTSSQSAKSSQNQGAATVIGSSLLPAASKVGSVATLLVIGLLGLALLLVLFLLLLGFALGRRRQARAAA
jgi:cobalamin biosynthesis Mg chelatase CobN